MQKEMQKESNPILNTEKKNFRLCSIPFPMLGERYAMEISGKGLKMQLKTCTNVVKNLR
ncbi:hypothetical protein [Methanosarcina barkeri]|uniref:hypothetical protein n=1 Tax=Methanosarcina barkeri TaxID=2208 RepID=UPI001FB434BA|nr:hypothetical protein [Methanosarcina barkeri]